MNRCFCVRALFAMVIPAGPLLAQEAPRTDSAKLLTPETFLNLRAISDLQFSPDGTRLALVVSEPPKGEHRARHIWLYDKQSGGIRQFTYSAKTETSPRWSPDGKQLAFLSNRDDEQQLYVMRADGGEPKALTQPSWEIHEAQWHPGGTGLMLSATDHPESDQNTDRIFFLRLSDNSLAQDLAPRGPFGNIRIASDGKTIAYIGC